MNATAADVVTFATNPEAPRFPKMALEAPPPKAPERPSPWSACNKTIMIIATQKT